LVPLQKCVFTFLTKSIVGADPSTDKTIGETGFALLDSWLALQLLPITSIGILQPLEEIFLHSFPFPSILVSGPYKKLYNFVEKQGKEVIELAVSEYGLKKEEAINNILFVLGFNAFGGFSIFFPSLITTIGRDKNGLRENLREEVRRVLKSMNGEVGFESVKQMELVKSTVYEVLRLNPPVALQYGRARNDFVLTSHDTSFQVRSYCWFHLQKC
jgi:hydroperoxide lyase